MRSSFCSFLFGSSLRFSNMQLALFSFWQLHCAAEYGGEYLKLEIRIRSNRWLFYHVSLSLDGTFFELVCFSLFCLFWFYEFSFMRSSFCSFLFGLSLSRWSFVILRRFFNVWDSYSQRLFHSTDDCFSKFYCR